MNITITPTQLHGSITPPPSKSQAHRLIIAAALAEGTSRLSNVAFSQDIEATLSCMEELGAAVDRQGDSLVITGLGAGPMSPLRRLAHPRLDCGESGSTLRFLIPVALAVRGGGSFTGRGRLMERPQQPYFDLFDQKDISYETREGKLAVTGLLTPGAYTLPGNVSSQFVTGLLYALPLLAGDSVIRLTTELESADYVAMTRDALKRFGVAVAWPEPRAFHIPGGQRYTSCDTAVEADWSQAAFWYAAAGVGSPVEVRGMDPRSIQGDRVFVDWARMLRGEPLTGGLSASVPILGKGGTAPTEPVSGGRSAVSIDVSHAPDLVPPLAALGALTPHTDLYIKNAARLRIKESDRLSSVTAALTAMGADVTELADGLIIRGQPTLAGGCVVDSCNDHRIAMMSAIAATRCAAPVTLLGADCVAKSYPNFWEDYAALGGIITKSEGSP